MAKLTYMDKKEIIRLYDEERYGYSRMCRKRTFRRFTKIRTVFPTDESLFKSLYLAQDKITSKWNAPYGNWGIIYSSLQIIFEERV